MNPKNSPRQAGRSAFEGAIAGLANTLAAVATFFGTPLLYGYTISWVLAFTLKWYGQAWQDFVQLAWLVICSLLIFFISRATLSTALVMGGLSLAARLF